MQIIDGPLSPPPGESIPQSRSAQLIQLDSLPENISVLELAVDETLTLSVRRKALPFQVVIL